MDVRGHKPPVYPNMVISKTVISRPPVTQSLIFFYLPHGFRPHRRRLDALETHTTFTFQILANAREFAVFCNRITGKTHFGLVHVQNTENKILSDVFLFQSDLKDSF